MLVLHLSGLPWPPHCVGWQTQNIWIPRWRHKALLWLCPIQVCVVIRGASGRCRGHKGPAQALIHGTITAFAGEVWQHNPEAILVFQGNALQKMVEEPSGNRRIYSLAAGHKRVHVLHTMDVSCRKALTSFSVHGIHFYGKIQSNSQHTRTVSLLHV